MDVSFVIRQRLEAFGLAQRELAQAAQVTESYISQLLTRTKAPPAPNRTDIYDKMDKFLKDKVLAEKQKGKVILVTSHILSDLDELTTDVLYIIDGKLQFYKPIEQLKSETGEEKLGRAIARIMQAAA